MFDKCLKFNCNHFDNYSFPIAHWIAALATAPPENSIFNAFSYTLPSTRIQSLSETTKYIKSYKCRDSVNLFVFPGTSRSSSSILPPAEGPTLKCTSFQSCGRDSHLFSEFQNLDESISRKMRAFGMLYSPDGQAIQLRGMPGPPGPAVQCSICSRCSF